MKQRVVVGMSGGVDSSVSAALLKEQGYDVIGVYILGWTGTKEFPCAWQEEEKDARRVAEGLGIPFYTINLSKEYEKAVIDDFFANYRQGPTPNPDILCNKEIKFKALWEAVRQFEPDYLATGHYAAIDRQKEGLPIICQPKDGNKDQTYFLWGINKQILPHVLFPLGDKTKPEVRRLAKELKLPTAEKKDSQGICFVGPLKVRSFLAEYLKPKKGKAVLRDGREVGEHQGAVLYTIGQRLGAGSVDWTGDVPPLFVIAKDVERNILVVGQDKDTFSDSLVATSLNWLQDVCPDSFKAEAKIRYRQESIPVQVSRIDDELRVQFEEKVRAVTPGQSIVFYKNGQLLGGGVINRVPSQEKLLSSINE